MAKNKKEKKNVFESIEKFRDAKWWNNNAHESGQ